MSMPRQIATGSQQRGVALITAILIVALVTVAAVAMASRQQLDMRRTGNLLEADQGYLFALAGETWARQILLEDGRQSTVDSLAEDWAISLPPVPVEGGAVGGRIIDLQGRFNLNNLVDANGVAVEEQRDALKIVLAEAGHDSPEIAISPFMANRILDWIDSDIDALPDGAEDLDYLNLTVPYRTANRRVVSPSELAAVSGFTLEQLAVLMPLVTSLPENTPLNVNTAPLPVMMSLHEKISVEMAADLIATRDEQPFASVEAFISLLKDDYEIELEPGRISVSSDYFLVSIDATIGQTDLRLYSVLQRKNNQVHSLRRSIGTI